MPKVGVEPTSDALQAPALTTLATSATKKPPLWRFCLVTAQAKPPLRRKRKEFACFVAITGHIKCIVAFGIRQSQQDLNPVMILQIELI